MKNSAIILWLLAWVPASTCTNKDYSAKINSYLNAADTLTKSMYMADNFHSFFMNKNGVGKNRTQALESFQNWDGPMHPDVKILSYSFHDSIWLVTFNEQNDFSKLIGFPGWKGTTTFTFNAAGLIKETVYIPDSTNLSYHPFLQLALVWLQKDKPEALDEVYQNGKLIQTEATAVKWRTLLQEWNRKKITNR
jgi:hypothetical protein